MSYERSAWPEGHPALPGPKVGVLLLNLGTPDAPNYGALRRYLRQFLSDRRVIEINPVLWRVILELFILTFRPLRSARAYRSIWMHDRNESPLRYYTRHLAEQIQARCPELVVDWGMRYGNPSIAAAMERLQAAGCDRILALSPYAQYAASTTGAYYDEVFRALQSTRWQPAIRTAPPFHDDPAYIDAVAAKIEASFAESGRPEVLLASFHGIPQSYFDNGDPYHCQCARTTRLLRERLGLDEQQLRMTFQSRFGPQPWIKPYTDHVIEALAKDGVKHLGVVMPGFPMDCLETLEEIAIGERERFEAHGGERFTVVPCLNDDPAHADMLAAIIGRELGGWIELTSA